MFWEMDFVGMDFSPDVDLDMLVVEPDSAMGTGAVDWTSALRVSDTIYMAQEHIGDVTELIYHVPAAIEQQEQSIFLHTRGYYELIRDFEGLPKMAALKNFREIGYFSTFSREVFLGTMNGDEEYVAIFNTNEYVDH